MVSSAALRIVEREALVFRRLWRGTAFTTFVGPVLFLGAIGLGLGGLVEENQGSVDGLSYLVFVAPGLLVAGAVQAAASESLWPIMSGTKWQRTYHGMVATPISPADVLAGYAGWLAIRAAISSTAFLVIAALLGGVPSAWGVLAVPAAVLCATAFTVPLCGFAAAQDSELAFPLVMRLGIVPLFLFSGTFFPVDQLPGWLAPLVVASPMWHGIELARAATTGSVDPVVALAHVTVLVAVIALGWVVGSRTWQRRLSA